MLKINWWYWLLRRYVKFGINLYFKTVSVHGLENIPLDGPVMFAANHQNAFLDALLVATSNVRHTHFLARADVFKIKILRKFLGSLNMMPVYRIRDGFGSLNQNHQVFEKCFDLLDKGQAILLFPEANHHQRRLLLPLSKGFTRIALGVDQVVTIIPVGLNYTHHRKYGGSVSIHYGEPISNQPYPKHDPRSNRSLRQDLFYRMQHLITAIPDNEHYTWYQRQLDLNPIQYLDPVKCNQWIEKTQPQDEKVSISAHKVSVGFKVVSALSFILNLPPLLLCNWILSKIGDPVFTSSIKFVSGITLFPLYYVLIAIAISYFFGFWVFIIYMLVSIFSLLAKKWLSP